MAKPVATYQVQIALRAKDEHGEQTAPDAERVEAPTNAALVEVIELALNERWTGLVASAGSTRTDR